LFTSIRYVCETKHNLTFVRQLIKIVSEDDFFAYVLVIITIFKIFCFIW